MNRNWSRIFLIALAAGAMLLAGGCQKKATGPSNTRDVLGTKVTITIYDPGHKAEELKTLFDDQFAFMADWEKRTLSPGADNQVRHISTGAGEQSVTTDQDVFQMLMKAIRLYDNSGQVFDIRYGPMLDAWGFGGRPHVPSPQQLDTLKSYVAEGGMFVAGNGILLAKPGMRFDVRELVEGYVFDQVAARLAEKGIRTATIHSQYVWRLMGDPPERRGFPVTLGNPVTGDSAWATVWAPVGGVAYAAVSKDRFEANGKSYHSLLDPRTGMPANKLLGAVAQAADAATAQAMAYAVFVHGTVDSLDKDGKNAVGGSILIGGTKDSPQISASGSLADRIHVGK
jgi:thiamine biosynthesis lipoprotein